MFGFDGLFIFLSVISSIINCYLILYSLKIDRFPDSFSKLRRLTMPVAIGMTFFLTNLFVFLSFNHQLTLGSVILYFAFFIIIASYGSKFTVETALKNQLSISQFIKKGLLLSLLILTADYLAVILLFHDYFHVKWPIVLMTLLCTIGIAFSSLRFLLQLSRETSLEKFDKWTVIGALAAGFAFSGIPYLVAMSVAQLDNFYVNGSFSYNLYFLPYILEMVAMLTLSFIPAAFGESKFLEQHSLIEEKNQYYRSLFDHNPDAVFSVDLDGNFTTVNNVATLLTGYKKEELIGRSFLPLLSIPKESCAFFEEAKNGVSGEFEFKVHKKNRELIDLRIIAVPIFLHGEVVGVYGIAKDITEHNANLERIHHLAHYDELTGLPNRRSFTDHIQKKMNENTPFALINMEFDRVKTVKEVFGYKQGDQLLNDMVKRLENSLPPGSFLSYHGADEFTALIPFADISRIQSVIYELEASFNQAFQMENLKVLVTSKFGISLYPQHGSDPDVLLKNAHIAKGAVTEHSFNSYSFFQPKLEQSSISKILIENELKKAIEESELSLYFQAKHHSLSGKPIGVEALARWNHPVKGLISPAFFIPIAEETNLIIKLDEWVIKEACSHINRWKDKGLHDISVSINLSQRSFSDPHLVKRIKDITSEMNINPSCLELEITESMTMFNEKTTIRKLKELKELGFKISIDDFGTGYSSLSYIGKLPIDTLKIDKTFIDQLNEEPTQHAIVTTIISIAQQLQVSVVAEGVESIEQVIALQELNCYHVQGYFFSKPVPAAEIEQLVFKKII